MSRAPEPHQPTRWARATDDAGFSMVEVMAAMLIFSVLAVASLGFVMTSLSATALARTDTVAKNLNQELLESMRNLPYHTHANVSTTPDLLDTYFTSTATPASGVDASGFVVAGGARDVSKGDPATGPFYRRVLGAVDGYDAFTRRVTAQFLGNGGAVLANPVFVSASTGSTGLAPSPTIAVRVTTLWTSGADDRSFTIESQITDGVGKAPKATLQGRLSVLRFTGVLPDSREIVAEAGVVNLDGSVATTAVGSAVVQSAQASVANGSRISGATGTLTAPPSGALTVAPLGPLTLVEGSPVAAFSGTSVGGLAVSTTGGLPNVGTDTQPVTAVLAGNGLGGDYFQASNRPQAGTRLGPFTAHVVRAWSPSCGGSCQAVKATGQLVTTSGTAHAATARLGGAVAGTVGLIPTLAFPDGVVKVTLSSVSAECRSKADESPRGTVTLAYAGTVSYPTYDPITGTASYSAPIPISSTQASDPLAAVDLQTVIGVDSAGGVLRLGDYVQSWSSLSSAAVAESTVVASDGAAAGISVPGVFTFTSKPLRDDPVSTVGLQLGAVSCMASDIR